MDVSDRGQARRRKPLTSNVRAAFRPAEQARTSRRLCGSVGGPGPAPEGARSADTGAAARRTNQTVHADDCARRQRYPLVGPVYVPE